MKPGEDITAAATSGGDSQDYQEVIPAAEIKRLERDNILRALKQCRWQVAGPGGAAELLGMKSTTLASRIKKLGLKKSFYPASTDHL